MEELIYFLSKMPGLGSRSARRIVLALLKKKEILLDPLIAMLEHVREKINKCPVCYTLDIQTPCTLCTNPKRQESRQICIIEDIDDLWAFEKANIYKGMYHVLGGVLSAMDGITPQDLHIPQLVERINTQNIDEIVFALNTTPNSQTTLYYLLDQLNHSPIKKTILAQGLPTGGEIHYLDEGTLLSAFEGRRRIA
jgi:recombination protein RecR